MGNYLEACARFHYQTNQVAGLFREIIFLSRAGRIAVKGLRPRLPHVSGMLHQCSIRFPKLIGKQGCFQPQTSDGWPRDFGESEMVANCAVMQPLSHGNKPHSKPEREPHLELSSVNMNW